MSHIGKRVDRLVLVTLIAVLPALGNDKDLKITIPKRSRLTPVQALNREGVEAIRKHRYDKAENLFYKAYLYDATDPFTLNNLGYVSELQGQVERAQKFYSLAAEQASDAVIDLADARKLQGKPMREAITNPQDLTLRINRANVEAVSLLSHERAPEAESLLRETLKVDPRNLFTLNNMGVTLEAEGDLEGALRYYNEVQRAQSNEPVVVTKSASARGKPLSQVAADSARRVQQRIESESNQTRAAELNLRGVYAINRNDWRDAEGDFQRAYKLDPYSAFSQNNIGYLAEEDGDLESAQFFYESARKAGNADGRVSIASRQSAEGMKLAEVATTSDKQVSGSLAQEVKKKRQEKTPIELKRRDGKPIDDSDQTPPASQNPQSQLSQPPVPAQPGQPPQP